MTTPATHPARKGRLVVICGPSGSGKTTVIERLRAEPRVRVSVSHTTRPPRADEVDGRDYHFVDREAFLAMKAADDFIETNDVFSDGHLYGSTWADLDAALADESCVYIMEVDVIGAANLKAAGLDMELIFIRPPSMEVLERRLRDRGTDDDAAIERRLGRARDEMRQAEEAGAFMVTNESLDRCVDEVRRRIGLSDTSPSTTGAGSGNDCGAPEAGG